jgi:tripartite-type tricarboxylate transporter receptor subunit TctC
MRLTTKILTAFFVLSSMAGSALAQAWPSKPLRLVVPFAPGGGADLTGRLLAQKLSDSLGQPVVVENRPGAGGTMAIDVVAKSPPDGYTIIFAHVGGIAIAPHLYKKLPFDPVKDLTPVSLVANAFNVLVVNPSLPIKSVKDLIAFAKNPANKVAYGSAGSGTDTHLAAELFKSMTDAPMLHVPYKGGAPAMVDLIGGQVQLIFSSVSSAIGHIKTGKVRPLAMSGSKRFELLPDVPTIAEAGVPGYEVNNWYGVLVPKGTPNEIVSRLNTEVANALKAPEVRTKLLDAGLEPVWNTPAQFSVYINSELGKWGKIVKESGAVVD